MTVILAVWAAGMLVLLGVDALVGWAERREAHKRSLQRRHGARGEPGTASSPVPETAPLEGTS